MLLKLRNTFNQFIQILFVSIFLVCCANSANCFNSQYQYENYVTDSGGVRYLDDILSCIKLSKIISAFSDLDMLYNISMPKYVDDKDAISKADKDKITSMIATTYAIMVANTAALASIMIPFYGTVALLLIGAQVTMLFDVCTNTYILQPHEYTNYLIGGSDYIDSKKSVDGETYNGASCAASAIDVPYYFQCSNVKEKGYSRTMCDPYVTCDYNTGACSSNGIANTTCNPSASPPIKPDPYAYSTMTSDFGGNVGSVIFAHDGGTAAFVRRAFGKDRTRFRPDKVFAVQPSGSSNPRQLFVQEMGVIFNSYYRADSITGAIEACVMTPYTFLPVLIGCAPVAPPLERTAIKPTFDKRCAYVLSPRKDLNSLGKEVLLNKLPGGSSSYATPIARFLKSDFHIASTMIGCMKDIIEIVMVTPAAGSVSFIEMVQVRTRGFVLAILGLYVALVGIKIMISEGKLSKGQYIMFIVKFAMVLYLNTGAFWAEKDSSGNSGLGVFYVLMSGQDYLASIFVDAFTENDPTGQCSYNYKGKQLFSSQIISGNTSLVNTNGYNGVVLSIWDMIDCKLINYLNLGSCNFNIFSILLGLLISLSLINPLFLLVCLMFAMFTVSMVFKFVRIVIIVSIVLATLVIVSPIFSCFMLFEKTMPMFQSWVKSLIGNMLYPAFLMGYFCLMIVTMDSLYYGDIDMTKGLPPGGGTVSRGELLEEACRESKSVYCATVYRIGDPCGANVKDLEGIFTRTITLIGDIKLLTVREITITKYFIPIVRLSLFSLLFYFLMDAGIGFIAGLSNAEAVGSIASGGVLSSLMSMFISKIAGMAMSAARGKK